MGRIHFRLGLGAWLSAPWPELLSQTDLANAIYPGNLSQITGQGQRPSYTNQDAAHQNSKGRRTPIRCVLDSLAFHIQAGFGCTPILRIFEPKQHGRIHMEKPGLSNNGWVSRHPVKPKTKEDQE